jgi:2-polyprenyl-6-methoxyphenol hydroxylase-like FAD-dependent oxidoreductase
MRVLIAGAGIAGLTLSALLRQKGIKPQIVDRASDFAQAGYKIGVIAAGPIDEIGHERIGGSGARLAELFDAYQGIARAPFAAMPADDKDMFFWNLEDCRAAVVQGPGRADGRCGLRLPADRGRRRLDGDGIGGRAGRRAWPH